MNDEKPTKRLTFQVPAEDARELKIISAMDGVPMQAMVSTALADYLARRKERQTEAA